MVGEYGWPYIPLLKYGRAYILTCLHAKFKVGVLRHIQQPGSYWDRSSSLSLVGIEAYISWETLPSILITSVESLSLKNMLGRGSLCFHNRWSFTYKECIKSNTQDSFKDVLLFIKNT